MMIRKTFSKECFPLGVIVIASALLLSACSSLSLPFSSSNAASERVKGVDATPQSADDSSEMRAECIEMHEEMKAKMSDGGKMMGDGAMSPEAKEKHQQCMEILPEMREEMHEKCMQLRRDGTGMEDGMEQMHEHCLMVHDKKDSEMNGGK